MGNTRRKLDANCFVARGYSFTASLMAAVTVKSVSARRRHCGKQLAMSRLLLTRDLMWGGK